MKTKRFNKRLVGVIDLKNGRAVHAIAGKREDYLAIDFCNGDPRELVAHYVGLGVRQIYLADLDAIGGTSSGLAHVRRLVASFPEVHWIVDAGNVLKALLLSDRVLTRSNVAWVAATEWMQSEQELQSFCQAFSSEQVVLSLDFRHGNLQGLAITADAWLQNANRLGVRAVIVLDIASVGTDAGPVTCGWCNQIRRQFPDWDVYSGGGIRNEKDIETLEESGCNFFLVATSLQRCE